jgi:4-amino-4-deoxy-L-arabinose transferase-like glycosyltransferase
MDYRNTPAGQVRVQSMWIYFGLYICTLGFYSWFAVARHMRTLRDFGRATGDVQLAQIKPWTYIVGMLFSFLIIPALIVYCIAFIKVQRLQAAVHPQKQTPTIHVIWSILFFGIAQQILINRTWRHYDRVPDALAAAGVPVASLPAAASTSVG